MCAINGASIVSLVDRKLEMLPCTNNLCQTLLNAQLFVCRANNLRYGLIEVMQLHGKQVLQSECLRVHVKVLPCELHQLLPMSEEVKEYMLEPCVL